ncbi:MAG: hypothetical protein JW795_01985, partial [Chitinivibrionales bacterium]|nr:hypothetical protein [Chitinivibrionales bacterium]
ATKYGACAAGRSLMESNKQKGLMCTGRITSKKVIIEQSFVLTSFGSAPATIEKLMQGQTALQKKNYNGLTKPLGMFPLDPKNRFDQCIHRLCSQLNRSEINQDRCVVIFCSAKGDIDEYDSIISHWPALNQPSGVLLENQARKLCRIAGINPGRLLTVSTACTSGSSAMEVAGDLLHCGLFSQAILYGYDGLSTFVVSGFNALGALAQGWSKPFDKNRDGLCLGEAAACMVMSAREPQPGDIVVAGASSSNDAHHRTGPSRSGEGLLAAAAAACRQAAIAPHQLGAVKCHGTATIYNDASEAKALHTLFHGAFPPCVSLKGALGHCSGGGCLMEIGLAAEFLKIRKIPPTVGFHELGVEENIAVSTTAQTLQFPSILCLSSGFGGLNSALILQEEQAS